jgi:transcriptional regulator with XRE-family HTH domain
MDDERARLDVAAKVKALRLSKKLSQAEAAALAGLKQPYLARVESGKQYPTVQTLQRIAKALGRRLEVRFV